MPGSPCSRAVEGGEPAVSEVAAAEGGRSRLGSGARRRVRATPVAARAAQVDLPQTPGRRPRRAARRFVIPGDDEWPDSLTALRFCDSVQRRGGVPFGLWLRGPGHLAQLLERSVSIVGSRACSAYGGGVATDLAADLAEAGVAVVSGGAYGIDVAAHRGALAVSGPTICVLANGVDVGYPRGNAAIFERLAADGLLVVGAAAGDDSDADALPVPEPTDRRACRRERWWSRRRCAPGPATPPAGRWAATGC